MIKVRNINDVVQYQLCTGCGGCVAAESQRYEMVDVEDVGRRPKVKSSAPEENGDAFAICPGHRLQHDVTADEDLDRSLFDGWGPVLEVWEGYAADDAIRSKGSSGGAATALSLFGLESGLADKVLHTGSNQEKPHLNATVFSESRDQLMSRAGSRYAPASPCEGLAELANTSERTVFVGKPCDVAAAKNWEAQSGQSLAVKIGFFCAGVPSTAGNLSLIKKQQIDVGQLASLKYRGDGWPGLWQATENSGKQSELTYADSWGYLQKFRQWRCYICPDHTGEFADIAVGDPWYRPIEPGELGKSLIIARTPKGKRYLEQAVKAGYLVLETKDSTLLPRSQPNLMGTRGGLWGRLLVLRIFGAAVPEYIRFKTFKFWWRELSLKEKISSVTGTAKRVFRKKLRKPMTINY